MYHFLHELIIIFVAFLTAMAIGVTLESLERPHR